MELKKSKSNKININSFDELLVFFRKEDTTIEQIQDVCNKGLIIFFIQEHTDKEALINIIIDYWEKWKHTKERPLFIDREFE
jgi:hypothetical protein